MLKDIEHLSRQRLDFSRGPQGECIATLTVTLQDGSVRRFTGSTNDEEVRAYGAMLGAAESRLARIEGVSEDEIGGVFDFVEKAFNYTKDKAQKIASSKAFKAAGAALIVAAPVLGPLAPAALAVGAGMTAAGQLSDATIAWEAKAKRVSRNLTKGAKKKLEAEAKANPLGESAALLRYANKRRKGAKRRAEAKPTKREQIRRAAARRAARDKPTRGIKYKPSKRDQVRDAARRAAARRRDKPTRGIKYKPSKPSKPSKPAPSPVRAAKRGELRSNLPGGVTTGELKQAAKRGRIFWVA